VFIRDEKGSFLLPGQLVESGPASPQWLKVDVAIVIMD
jgi:hypothetical protein